MFRQAGVAKSAISPQLLQLVGRANSLRPDIELTNWQASADWAGCVEGPRWSQFATSCCHFCNRTGQFYNGPPTLALLASGLTDDINPNCQVTYRFFGKTNPKCRTYGPGFASVYLVSNCDSDTARKTSSFLRQSLHRPWLDLLCYLELAIPLGRLAKRQRTGKTSVA